jgi:hypothetical protein
LKRTVNNIIVDNKFLSRSGVKERKKKIDNDIALYQDFIIDGYKNALSNNKKNIIERLGECIEKKHQTIDFWKKNYKKIGKMEESDKIPKEKLFKEYKNFQKSMIGTGFVNDPKSSSLYGNGYYTNVYKINVHIKKTKNGMTAVTRTILVGLVAVAAVLFLIINRQKRANSVIANNDNKDNLINNGGYVQPTQMNQNNNINNNNQGGV